MPVGRIIGSSLAVALAAACLQPLQAADPATRPGSDPFLTHEGSAPPATLPTINADDLVHYRLQEGLIIPTTRLQPVESQTYQLDSLDVPVSVTIMQRTPATGRYIPDSLQIISTRQGPEEMIRTSLFAVSGQLNLARDIAAGEQEMTIQFVQSPLTTTPGQALALHIQKLNPATVEKQQTYAADNFPAFIRTYPLETNRYVRPMLEAFSPQPHLFAVSDELAWTIFPEAFPLDTQTRQKILELVKQLNADSFQQRQQATKALQDLGVRGATVLATLDRSALQPEQTTRIDGILARVKPAAAAKPELLRSDPSFLLDCLMSPNRPLRQAALAQLQTLTNPKLSFPIDGDDQQRITAAYALRKTLLPDFTTTRPAR